MYRLFKIGLTAATLVGIGLVAKKVLKDIEINTEVVDNTTSEDFDDLDTLEGSTENNNNKVQDSQDSQDNQDNQDSQDNQDKSDIDKLIEELNKLNSSNDSLLEDKEDDKMTKSNEDKLLDGLKKLDKAAEEVGETLKEAAKGKLKYITPKLHEAKEKVMKASEKWAIEHPDILENIKKSSKALNKATNGITSNIDSTISDLLKQSEKKDNLKNNDDNDDENIFKDSDCDIFAEKPKDGVDINLDLVEDAFDKYSCDPFNGPEIVLDGEDFKNDLK